MSEVHMKENLKALLCAFKEFTDFTGRIFKFLSLFIMNATVSWFCEVPVGISRLTTKLHSVGQDTLLVE